MKKKMPARYRCVVLFCRSPEPVAVRLEIRMPGGGWKTNWLCLDHAIGTLGQEKADLIEDQIEEAKNDV